MVAPVVLSPGSVFAGDYRIERPLAEGGMGAVYVVEQQSTGKRRALKVMHPTLAPDAKSRARFVEEARVGARIESDHVVDVLAAGVDEASGIPWLVMELLEGQDLDQLVRARGALPPDEVLALLSQVGHALGAAHRIGIIHRDLKPENLFLARSRRQHEGAVVKILDFGIARMVEGSQTAATVTSAIGSPLWMAPEQAQPGAKLRPSTDVWALGLIAFYLLTGKSYWRAANHPQFNLSALLVEAMTHPIEPPSARAAELGAAVPPGFDAWFLACVDRDPARRLEDAARAIDGLAAALSGAPVPRAVGVTQPLPASHVFVHAPPPPGLVHPAPAAPSRSAPIGLLAVALIGLLLLGGAGLYGAVWAVGAPSDPVTAAAAPSPAEVARAAAARRAEAEADRQRAEAVAREAEAREAEAREAEARAAAAREDAGARIPPEIMAQIAEQLRRSEEERSGTGSSDDRAHGGLVGRSQGVPRVRTGNADVRGSLSREVIRRVIQRHVNEVRFCYEQQLASEPGLEGRFTVSFIIGPTGAVQSASIGSSTLGNAPAESCIVAAVRRWTFPPPEGGGVVAVSYPFVLSASG